MVFSCAPLRLEETSRDLRETKVKLSEEAFICSELSSAQETLYDTAGQVQATLHSGGRYLDILSLHHRFLFSLSLLFENLLK